MEKMQVADEKVTKIRKIVSGCKRSKMNLNNLVSGIGKIINSFSALVRLLPFYRKKVLILKNDGLGDLIIFLPFAAQLRRYYNGSGYEVCLMVREPWKDLAQCAQCADRIIVQPSYRNAIQWGCFRLIFWLRSVFDIIVEGVCEAHDITDCCSCQKRVNIFLDGKWQNHSANTVSCNVSGMTIHERYKKVLELCGTGSLPAEGDFSFIGKPLPEMDLSSPYILICPDSNDPRKCWEEEKFAELIRRIRKESGKRIILTGLDSQKSRSLISLCGDAGCISDLCGKIDLFQLFTLVRQCDLLISSDTGTAHIGAALKRPTVVICGRGEYGTFFPYPTSAEGKYVFSVFSETPCRKCFWRDEACLKLPTYKCLAEISVDSVWRVCQTYLKKALL